MNATDLLERIGDSLGSAATVKSVFGEPIQSEGRTVVPVAKVAYGFGAGAGSGRGKNDGQPNASGEGGGGGGGVRAFPAGALEITPSGTRFVKYWDPRWLVAAFAAGAVVARLWGGRRSRG